MILLYLPDKAGFQHSRCDADHDNGKQQNDAACKDQTHNQQRRRKRNKNTHANVCDVASELGCQINGFINSYIQSEGLFDWTKNRTVTEGKIIAYSDFFL